MGKYIGLFCLVGGFVVGQSGAGTILSEDFSTDPSERGWIYMAVNPWALQPAMPPLVTWDAAAENLAVSWDPSKPTSLYQIPLGRALTESHTITFRFDLRFSTIVAADFFQIGIGLRRASYLEFDRTGGPFPPGNRCRDLFELAYLPKADPEWGGPWLQPTICTSDGQFRANFTSPSRALPAGKNLGFTLRYDPTRRSVLMDLTIDGVPAITASPESALLPGDEFFVDTLGIFIYGDVLGADPANDLLAGVVDNISVEAQTPSFVDTFELYR